MKIIPLSYRCVAGIMVAIAALPISGAGDPLNKIFDVYAYHVGKKVFEGKRWVSRDGWKTVEGPDVITFSVPGAQLPSRPWDEPCRFEKALRTPWPPNPDVDMA